MTDELGTVTIEGAQIIFRNFTGKEGQYNAEGDRNFAVILEPETAERMLKDGWNVKTLEPRDEADDPTPYLPVRVSYKYRPPKIIMITSTSRTPLDEDAVGTLDWAQFKNVDLIVNPSEWHVNGKSGIKAYLKTMFVTIEEDELERKYAVQEQG